MKLVWSRIARCYEEKAPQVEPDPEGAPQPSFAEATRRLGFDWTNGGGELLATPKLKD